MTFIASVIAKEGIAIVSDSFGTTMEHSLNETNLLEYLIAADDKEKIPVVDLVRLFEKKASHTRNYIDKLFKFDEFSAITFTGAIYINGKEIKEIVKVIAAELQVDTPAYKAKDINQILDEFRNKLKIEIIEHGKNDNLTSTDLIFSHFNVRSNQPQIFMIKVKELIETTLMKTIRN
ncbi:hypothetical protein [Pedobacter hartonius]|uniref:Uncharacterized protein n=1 Tax=Pedobacter hartonius TaxID=425514 RepID=A0A1H4G3V8_9SPHI|nr:hypothetical protein [Pedobacter hartonius]SEB04001.1 hypothetical protein SAMN05443550_1094 [Pedobacter hartonius]